jgi:hypothetical protein
MVRDQLLAIEKSFWRSSGDADFYRTHVADEGKFVLSMGVVDKSDVVTAMSEAAPWKSFDINDVSVIPIGDDVVGLIYEASGQREAGADEYRANILSVYRKNGDWELILHQQTPLDA